ncbi:tyrosine/nicotianamine aminotransferase [Nitzschia inconspicua]|uniref:Tyrosine/nicotianamine aminotransferase n=1 Tax=Nitzschia inconspicua TaxID=303405 RepID=A0A9K3M7K0_9STRA|nr:tyrosine/nicotianamine aminotransferase [Nitzschia inconspicua]
MPITDPIYRSTFPPSQFPAQDEHPSPNSVIPTAPYKHDPTNLDVFQLEHRPVKMQKRDDAWICPVSSKASQSKKSVKDMVQPIVEMMQLGCHRPDGKNPISLATADPTMPHLSPCTKAMEAVVQASMYKPHSAAYTHASGTPEARRAIAMHHSFPERPLSPDHVIVTNGCSGALELALSSLLDPGTTVLVPQPGFPLYEEIATSLGAHVVHYRLDPTKGWECDLDHLHELMLSEAETVRALVVNNPSSHGSVFSKQHLERLVNFAFQHRLPIVSDEVYGSMTFGSNKYHPLAQVAAWQGRHVPVITTSGISKQFMVPGWRIGWVTFHDNVYGSLRQVEEGAHRLAQTLHGVSRLTQAAIPTLLSATTPGLADWKEKHRVALERQGMLLCSSLNDCFCLKVGPPQGSMYALASLFCERLDDSIQNDMEFALRLVQEENVFVLPGSTFGAPGTVRVAFSASEETLELASKRIADFCRRHAKHRVAPTRVLGV